MPAIDPHPPGRYGPSRDDPAEHAAAVTPSDAAELAYVCRALFVGTGGDVEVVTASNETVILTNVPSGTLLPLRCKKVKADNTDADDIVAFW